MRRDRGDGLRGRWLRGSAGGAGVRARRVAAAASLAAAMAWAMAVPAGTLLAHAAGPGAVRQGAPVPARSVQTGAPVHVNVRTLPPPPSGSTGTGHAGPHGVRHGRGPIPFPFHPRHPHGFAAGKAGHWTGGGPRRSDVHNIARGAPLQPASGGSVTGSAPVAPVGPALPLMNLDTQLGIFGGSEGLVPPDTQVAAGPNNLVEFDNAAGSIWSKSGAPQSVFDLNGFFGVPAMDSGYGAFDVQVLYDPGSGRWFASTSAADPTVTFGQVFLAVSQTSNPNGAWYVYTLAANSSSILYDQPMLGVSGDKVVVSWNDFIFGGTYYGGAETWVLQKSDLLAGGAAAGTIFGPDTSRFRLVPARSAGTANTEYLVYNNADPQALVQNTPYPSLGVVAITGSPAQGNVAWTEYDPQIAATSVPPNAAQPQGGPGITTDDDRIISAFWQGGALWAAANDACVPPGGTAVHSCLRLIQVSTAGPVPQVEQDFDVSQVGTDLYYPAVAMDGAGNLFVAFGASSTSTFASVMAAEQPVGAAPGTLGGLLTVEPGLGVYCGLDCASGQGTNRWGDYSAASVDPSQPGVVWVAGEYADTSPSNVENWGTAVQPLSVS